MASLVFGAGRLRFRVLRGLCEDLGCGTQAALGPLVPRGAREPPLPAAQAARGVPCRAFPYSTREVEQTNDA